MSSVESTSDGSGLSSQISAFLNSPRFVLVVLVIALVLRLAWLFSFPIKQVMGDYIWMNGRAKALAAGRGYVLEDGTPTAYRPIGYPFSLSLIYRVFGPNEHLGQLANVFYSTAIAAGTYLLGRRLFSETAARISLLLMALFPNQIAYNTLLAAEPLFTMLFVASLVVTFTPGRSRWTGLALGVLWATSWYIRPITLFMVPIYFLCLGCVRHDWKNAAAHTGIAVVILVALLMPYAVRNRLVFGHWILTNEDGLVMLVGANPYATGDYHRAPIISEVLPKVYQGGRSEYEWNQKARELAMQYIREHPIHFAELGFQKLYHMYKHDKDGFRHTLMAIDPPVPDFVWKSFGGIAQLFYLGVICLAIAYVVQCVVRRELFVLPNLLWIFIAYYSFVVFMLHGLPRYHYSCIPLFALYAAQFLQNLLARETDESHVHRLF